MLKITNGIHRIQINLESRNPFLGWVKFFFEFLVFLFNIQFDDLKSLVNNAEAHPPTPPLFFFFLGETKHAKVSSCIVQAMLDNTGSPIWA